MEHGLDNYDDWIDYAAEFESVKEVGPQTSNMLESHNRTWNSLVGPTPNVWFIQELFIKQDAKARRVYLSNAVDQDMTTNTGRKQRSLDARERVKFVFDAFDSMPRADYISTLAHDRHKFDH